MRRPSRRTVLLTAAGLPLAAGGVYWATRTTDHLELNEPHGLEPLAVAPDGRWLVAGNYMFASANVLSYTRFTVWDLTTGRLARVLDDGPPSSEQSSRMTVSPDGRRLAWERQGHRDEPRSWIGLLDTATWEPVATVDDDGRLIGFTPDGAGLWYGHGDTVRRYDLASGASRDTRVPFDPSVWAGMTPLAGDRAAVEQRVHPGAADETRAVTLWDLATGRKVAGLVEGLRLVSVVGSADGRFVAAGGRVFEAASGREVWRADGEPESLTFVGPRLLVARYDEPTRVYDTTTWAEVGRLDTGQRLLNHDVHPSPDGTMAVFRYGDRLELVDFVSPRGRTLATERTSVARVLWSRDSRTVVVGQPGDYIRGRRNRDAYFTQVWKLPAAK